MTDKAHTQWANEYNTVIKDIGGVKDYSLIFKIINAYFDTPDAANTLITDNNEFDLRASKTRDKVSWAVNKSVLQFVSAKHKDLVSKVFQEQVPLQDRNFAFLWHFCIENRLFREITIHVFTKIYFSGRAQISNEDIIAYIKDISDNTTAAKPSSWSEETIYRIATKYLNLMSKFGFISTGRVKTFNHIRPSTEALVIFLYFATLASPESKNILINEILPTSFITSDDIQNKLKKLSLKGFFEMSFNGIALNIELTHSHKEICDVLYS